MTMLLAIVTCYIWTATNFLRVCGRYTYILSISAVIYSLLGA